MQAFNRRFENDCVSVDNIVVDKGPKVNMLHTAS